MTFRDWRAFIGALIVGVLIIAIPAVNAWDKATGTLTIGNTQCLYVHPVIVHLRTGPTVSAHGAANSVMISEKLHQRHRLHLSHVNHVKRVRVS